MNRDFAEMLRALCAAGAEFLVVGGYAVIAHGWPRATGDIDLWVRPTPENAKRVMRALIEFGAPLLDLSEADLTSPGVVFQIGVVPNRIDILTDVEGLSFEDAWETRITATVEDYSVPILGRDALLKSKRAAGRKKDLLDVAWLEEDGEGSDA